MNKPLKMHFFLSGYPDMPEELLLKALFQKYNKNARPATVLMPVVTVDHGMDLIRINSFVCSTQFVFRTVSTFFHKTINNTTMSLFNTEQI